MKTVERTQPLPARARAEDNSMTNRERFLRACRCAPVDRPPVWLMRQAGRALPEYRELKTRHSFLQLVQTPELAAEVTVQPIRRFDFDAAILFCDILAVAEGLGQSYSFQEQRGIEMAFLVKTSADIDRLDETAVTHRLEYVREAIRQTKARLRERTALIGFSGSPWTLANFMMEGGGVRDYTAARRLFYSDAARFSRFFEKLTTAISSYLHMQIDAGVEAIQIFDSLGGLLSPRDFAELSGRWMNEVVRSLNRRVPVIVFSKGTHGNWDALRETGAGCLGVDWNLSMAEVRKQIPDGIALQGNLDPFLLTTTPDRVRTAARRILDEMKERPGHIFNLGHGVPPDAKLENIQALVETVRDFK